MEIVSLGDQITLENATIVLQLYDNSVFMVAGLAAQKASQSVMSVAATTSMVNWWWRTKRGLKISPVSWCR
jgi:hypothetical protein